MFQRAFARARGRRLGASDSRRPIRAAATPQPTLLPEALERRVLMASTVTISAGAAAAEFSGTLTFLVDRTSPLPPGTDYAFLTLGGAAHESGPGDDYDFVSGEHINGDAPS